MPRRRVPAPRDSRLRGAHAMWRFVAALLAVAVPGRAPAPSASPTSIVGRWDITIAGPDRSLPSWLEVRPSGNGYLVGQFVGVVGSARPIARVEFTDGAMRFAIPP